MRIRQDAPSLSELKRALRWLKEQYHKRALNASQGDEERIRRIIRQSQRRGESLRKRIS